MSEIEKIEQAIQALENQRDLIGDEIVNSALGPLREKLAVLLTSISTSQLAKIEDTHQRRIITVLLADVSRFTAMSEHQDAEDVHDMMNALWEKLDGAILTHGGRIDKHMGDGVMALWGADETREDDAERAVRCALAMQMEVAKFRPTLPIAGELKIRVGLHTGPVLIGLIGIRGEITTMGDTIDTGIRLEQNCPVGEILVSQDTYQRVRGVFDLEPHNSPTSTIPAYLVKRAKPRAFRIDTRGVEGVETRMVGREHEMEQLKVAFKAAFLHDSLQIITVVADAGLGKSRLISEFSAWADLQDISWWWFKGRASLSMSSAPYALLRDIFSFRFEIYDSDPLQVAQEKMEAGFCQFIVNKERAIEKAHVVGHLLGFNFSSSPHLHGLLRDPNQLHQQALYYLKQFFLAVAESGPALLMIDDLHWADTGSLDALAYVFESLPPSAPIMALTVTRPILQDRYPNWGKNIRSFQKLQLEPLSKDESRALVNQILQKVPELPNAVPELVIGGAEGNPFYLEELIKMLIDAQVIKPGQETWSINLNRLATVHIPHTLTEVIQARLDNLPAAERTTLQLGAVVGRIFWDQAIIALASENADERTFQALNQLKTKDLVFERRPSSFSATREYIFKHHLLREVTYNTMPKRQRTISHLSAAGWLIRVSGERRSEYLPQIAEHLEKGGDLEQATAILAEAAERALSLSALSEARTFFQQALDLHAQQHRPIDSESVALEIGLAKTLIYLGEYTDAQPQAEKALALAKAAGFDALISEALMQLGQITSYLGDYHQAHTHLDQALELARSEGSQRTIGRALTALGSVEWRLGNLPKAQEYALAGRQIAQALDDNETLLLALNTLGVVAGALDHPNEEEAYYQQTFKLAISIGNRERAAMALNNLGAQAGEQKQWQKAWDYYTQAMETSRETGARTGLALRQINLGYAGIKLGRINEAREYLREGAMMARQIGAAPILLSALIYFGLLAYTLGDVERALQLFGLAKTSPAYESEAEREINIFLADWQVPAAKAQAEFAQGAQLDLDTVLDELIVPN